MAEFEEGRAKTGGRQKGTPNKSTKALKDAVMAAFDAVGGEEYLINVAHEDPRTFVALLAKILPMDVTVREPVQITVIRPGGD